MPCRCLYCLLPLPPPPPSPYSLPLLLNHRQLPCASPLPPATAPLCFLHVTSHPPSPPCDRLFAGSSAVSLCIPPPSATAAVASRLGSTSPLDFPASAKCFPPVLPPPTAYSLLLPPPPSSSLLLPPPPSSSLLLPPTPLSSVRNSQHAWGASATGGVGVGPPPSFDLRAIGRETTSSRSLGHQLDLSHYLRCHIQSRQSLGTICIVVQHLQHPVQVEEHGTRMNLVAGVVL